MKTVFLFLLSVCLLVSCDQARTNNKPINKQIGQYIRQNCEENKPCKIKIKDATDFSWDKLYVFSEAVEQDVISKILKISYSSRSPYYSRKWFFLKDNQIVRTEEHIIYEIDDSVDNGDVLLERNNSQKPFSLFEQDAMFEVSKNKLDDKESYYYLRCINCPSN